MQDQYTGEAGTFVTDPETGERMPLEEWQALQKKKSERVNYLDTLETQADFEPPAEPPAEPAPETPAPEPETAAGKTKTTKT